MRLSRTNMPLALSDSVISQLTYAVFLDNLAPHLRAENPDHKLFCHSQPQNPPQLSKSGLAESQLLAAYIDEVQRTCTDRYLPEMTKVSPTAGQIFTQMVADNRATQQLLVNRQLSWGEAAQRSQTTAEAATEKVRTQGV